MNIKLDEGRIDIRNPLTETTVREIVDFIENHIDTDEVKTLVIGEFHSGTHIPFTLSLYLNNGQLCYCKTPLADDLSNWKIVSSNLCIGYLDVMEQTNPRETYHCTINGIPAQFSRVFGNYVFNDEECEKLAKGETIIFVSDTLKNNYPYVGVGRLEQQDYDGNETGGNKYVAFRRWGFKRDLSYRGLRPYLKKGQPFTKDEIIRLYNGEIINHQFADKNGFTRSTRVRYDHNIDQLLSSLD